MKNLTDLINEKLRVSNYIDLGLDIFDAKTVDEYNKIYIALLNKLLKISKDIAPTITQFNKENRMDQYVVFCLGDFNVIFVGYQDDDFCYYIGFDTDINKVQIEKLNKGIGWYIKPSHNDPTIGKHAFIAPDELYEFLKYCLLNYNRH